MQPRSGSANTSPRGRNSSTQSSVVQEAFKNVRTVKLRRNRARKGSFGFSIRGGIESGDFPLVVQSDVPPMVATGTLSNGNDILITINGRMVVAKSANELASEIKRVGEVIALGVCHVTTPELHNLAAFLTFSASSTNTFVCAVRRALVSAEETPRRGSRTAVTDAQQTQAVQPITPKTPQIAPTQSPRSGGQAQATAVTPVRGYFTRRVSGKSLPTPVASIPAPPANPQSMKPTAQSLEEGVLLELQSAMNQIIQLREERDAAVATAERLQRALDDIVPLPAAISENMDVAGDWAISTHFSGSEKARNLVARAEANPAGIHAWVAVKSGSNGSPIAASSVDDEEDEEDLGAGSVDAGVLLDPEEQHAAVMNMIQTHQKKDDPVWSDAWLEWGGDGSGEISNVSAPAAASASPELTAHDAAVADHEPELTDIAKAETTISQLRDVLHKVLKATGVSLEDLSLGVHPDELLPPRQIEMLDDPVKQSSVV
jgi:hypothetical protein